MKRFMVFFRQNMILFLLAAVLLFGICGVQFFTKTGNLYHLLLETSLYGIVAIGMTFVLLTGAVDISIGMQTALAAILTCLSTERFGFVPGLCLVMLAGLAIGWLNGAAVHFLRIDPLIVTLGTMTVLKGAGILMTSGESVSSANPALTRLYDYRLFDFLPLPTILFAGMLFAGLFLLRRTGFGVGVYVVGGNAEAGRLSGIHVARTQRICFALAGLCAAAGGVLLASRINVGTVILGDHLNVTTISSCIIGGISITGGRGDLAKMIAGVLLIQTVNNIMTLKAVAATGQLLITGGVLVLVLILDRFSPAGRAARGLRMGGG